MMAVAAIAGLAATGLSIAQRESEGKIARGQAEVAAAQEDLAVKAREADRKDRLASALASQNARAGAAGVAAFEGSPLTILQDQIEREKVATERDVLGAELASIGLRTAGRLRQRAGRTRSLISLGRTVGQFGSSGTGVGFKPSN